jgi:hypothetical protein
MSWLDSLYQRGVQAKRVTPVTGVTGVQPDRGEARPKARPDIQWMYVQTGFANWDKGDPGSVEIAYYSVSDGIVTMHDKDGKATSATARLTAGEDPRRTANRLKLEALRAGDEKNFNRSLNYPPLGYI